jgi:hypothetical protein
MDLLRNDSSTWQKAAISNGCGANIVIPGLFDHLKGRLK